MANCKLKHGEFYYMGHHEVRARQNREEKDIINLAQWDAKNQVFIFRIAREHWPAWVPAEKQYFNFDTEPDAQEAEPPKSSPEIEKRQEALKKFEKDINKHFKKFIKALYF